MRSTNLSYDTLNSGQATKKWTLDILRARQDVELALGRFGYTSLIVDERDATEATNSQRASPNAEEEKRNVGRELMFISGNGKTLDRKQIESLASQTDVSRELIDAWVGVMNDAEKFRSSDSLRRLFLTIDVAVININLLINHNII
ncbi:hypothetical protein L6452_08836 [Arctium lappa]|uniref:Uncharacterized protein n=1 Tax=Arctium lappa TaxID=4217 RepID=A0ACB9DID5_ARCLA|nr:hypothetical protein L6452_08836 [Arctium lappa]